MAITPTALASSTTGEQAGIDSKCKTQPPTAAGGMFAKDRFVIDLEHDTVTCPAGQVTPLKRSKPGRMASFGQACASCPLADQCTKSNAGRTVYVGPYEEHRLVPGPGSAIRTGRPTTAPPDPRWNARSPT